MSELIGKRIDNEPLRHISLTSMMKSRGRHFEYSKCRLNLAMIGFEQTPPALVRRQATQYILPEGNNSLCFLDRLSRGDNEASVNRDT